MKQSFKLSDMNGEQLRQALVELAPPLCAILQDEKTQRLLEKVMDPAVPLCSVMALVIGQGIPLLLQDHLGDICRVLSVLSGQSEESLRSMDGAALIRLIRALWDEELAAFFASAGTARRGKSSAK